MLILDLSDRPVPVTITSMDADRGSDTSDPIPATK
jgi:hypothetical protein